MAAELEYGQVTDSVLNGLQPPRRVYYFVMAVFASGITWALIAWIYQVHTGMGVAGISHPVGWGIYIANFVFWIGIAHSGTLISAILYLVRSKWRAAVSRSSEAMTIFAVMTAGLFPLIHLGRVWIFYYILPYPSERQIWPNFISPLVWDVCAVSTYFTVSLIFWYVGMLPDFAAARDRYELELGYGHIRTRVYRRLALGWAGAASQWRHYGRGYLFFAALATPLVISVHSVVSWDFAMSLLPGWHETIFAPYFVAGAIHSGLAMVLVLLIPMSRLLRLEKIMNADRFEALALTMLVTTGVVGYAYILEPFIAWYSGDVYEQQFSVWRATGGLAWAYWSIWILNVGVPLLIISRKVRRSAVGLFLVGLAVVLGMWLERYQIIPASTSHDFLPHNWGPYKPTWVEWSINFGAFAWFLFWFFAFAKLLPTISLMEVKDLIREERSPAVPTEIPFDRGGKVARAPRGVLAVFGESDKLLGALKKMKESQYKRLETFSPNRVGEASRLLGWGRTPVKYWCLGGALCGLAGGFYLAIGSAWVNELIVGAKHPVSLIPYCIPGFEGTVLLGSIGNLIGVIIHARLGRPSVPAAYDRRFSRDKFGLFVACEQGDVNDVKSRLAAVSPEEIRVIE